MRVITLVVLVGAFCVWAGPEIVVYGLDSRFGRGNHPSLVFLSAAIMATIVDLWVGNVCRSNWRFLLVSAGIFLMAHSVWKVHREKSKISRASVERSAREAVWMLGKSERVAF